MFTVLSFFGVCRCLHVSERGTGQVLEKDLELGVIFVVSLILALIEKVYMYAVLVSAQFPYPLNSMRKTLLIVRLTFQPGSKCFEMWQNTFSHV